MTEERRRASESGATGAGGDTSAGDEGETEETEGGTAGERKRER